MDSSETLHMLQKHHKLQAYLLPESLVFSDCKHSFKPSPIVLFSVLLGRYYSLNRTTGLDYWTALLDSQKNLPNEQELNPSLVPSVPHSPAENVWWFDLNILSVTPFLSGMWEEQQNRRTHNYMSLCHQSSKCCHNFILTFAIFVQKREFCASALCFFEGLGYKKPTYKQI